MSKLTSLSLSFLFLVADIGAVRLSARFRTSRSEALPSACLCPLCVHLEWSKRPVLSSTSNTASTPKSETSSSAPQTRSPRFEASSQDSFLLFVLFCHAVL